MWSHLLRASSLRNGDTEGHAVWPVWLGLGPSRGLLLLVGVQGVKVVVFTGLKAAHVIVYTGGVGNGESAMQRGLVSLWRAGTNCRIARSLILKQRPNAQTAEFAVWLALCSPIRPRAESSLALLQQTLGGVQAAKWNKRVLDVWLGQLSGHVSKVAAGAMHHDTQESNLLVSGDSKGVRRTMGPVCGVRKCRGF